MSTVPISYGLKTIKLKASPGTPVSELLEKAASHFKLDSAATGLFHNTSELSTNLPFRLLNLPSGAKLTLKATKARKVSEITIKIQFINSPFERNAVVKKVSTQLTLEQLVKEIEKDLLSPILDTSKKLKFQGMTKVVTQEEFNTITVAQFGAENNASIRLIFETTNQITKAAPDPKIEEPTPDNRETVKPKTVTPVEKKDTIESQNETTSIQHIQDEPVELETQEDNKETETTTPESKDDADAMEIDEPKQNKLKSSQPSDVALEKIEKHVYVYKAPEGPIQTYEPDEEDYDLTVSHARQYQSILSQRAHESYKTKRLRQEANKKKITNIEIRIRFPDDSSLQANFTPAETNHDLYKFVTDTLINDSSSSFVLSIPYPLKEIANDNTKLTENFESRNLLLFKTEGTTNGPFLKDEYLDKAKDLKEAEDVKLDLERQNMKDDTEVDTTASSKIHGGQLPKKSVSSSNATQFSEDGNEGKKKVPKWLKLGKK